MQHVLPVFINAHATMVAQGITISDDLKAAFKNWLQPPDKEPRTSVAGVDLLNGMILDDDIA